jgi:hypothetical protein
VYDLASNEGWVSVGITHDTAQFAVASIRRWCCDDCGMQDAQIIARIERKYQLLAPEMDERRRRQWAAAEAREVGWGGVSLVARATGLSRPTIHAGMRELDQSAEQRTRDAARVRRPGGGRQRLVEADSDLLAALEALIDPVTRGPRGGPFPSRRQRADRRTEA